MNHKKQILEKITNNQEVIGIIGLGYVGLPTLVSDCRQAIPPGYRVLYKHRFMFLL